ncbi:MAG: hypothetical protein GX666_10195 [Tissierellia bacterium]|nr:hypothetical protein [Tissierellia bacterium]
MERIVNIDFNMSVVLKLADFFFGGAIADWIVLGKIGEAKLKITNATMQVLEVKAQLESLYR